MVDATAGAVSTLAVASSENHEYTCGTLGCDCVGTLVGLHELTGSRLARLDNYKVAHGDCAVRMTRGSAVGSTCSGSATRSSTVVSPSMG